MVMPVRNGRRNVEKPLQLKRIPTKYLDAPRMDFAVAVCHHFNMGKDISEKSYSGWDSFIKQNPGRIK